MKKCLLYLLLLMPFNSHAQSTLKKDFQTYYSDGKTISFYNNDTLAITSHLMKDYKYGMYYFVFLSVENKSDRRIDFIPDSLSAKVIDGKWVYDMDVIPYEEYDRKVRRRQNWSSFATTLNEYMAAGDAGSKGSAGRYFAQQNASNNVERYNNNQVNTRQNIADSYLKINSIFPGQMMVGYVLVDYRKGDELRFYTTIDGQRYRFTWNIK